MNKHYFFLDGMPRAGNTLLASILNQNPDVQTSANSLVIGLLHKIHSSKSTDLFGNFPDHSSLDNVIENIIPNYYKDWNYKYIIDRSNVGLGDTLMLLEKHLKNYVKIIVLDRNLEDIISSFIKAHKNWNLPIEGQVQHLLRQNGLIHNGMSSIKNLKDPKYKDITHFIMYEDLVKSPEQVIKGIYKFLEIPTYNHHFTNLDKFSSNGLTYNEEWYLPSKVTVNLHDIKTDNINLTRHEKLPEKIVKLCSKIKESF